jgi:5,5'-dehydrodivanillate O-demethylase oxygenase subunit
LATQLHRKPRAKNRAIRFDEIEASSLAGQYLRRFWHPIAIADDVKPGRAKPLRVMGDNFTLYRGEKGAFHLTEFRCPHRGTQLSVGWVEGDNIRCLYHGWKFDATGQCIEQPGETKSDFARKVSIATFPVQEYLGLVFGYFGPGQPPPIPRYSVFENGGYLDRSMYVRDCNYFQSIENGMDEVHVIFTHRDTTFSTSGHNDEVPLIEAEEKPYGMVEIAHRSANRLRETHLLMPNILFLKLPPELPEEDKWRDYVSWRVPIDHHVHMSFIVPRLSLTEGAVESYRHASDAVAARLRELEPTREVARRILAGELRVADVLDRPDLVGIQDSVTQIGQGLVADRAHERLGKSDVAIILLRKLWEREIRRLASGEPLTQWQVPEGLSSTIGI